MILVSGFFDPLHNGHLDYLEAASQYSGVVVALNSDAAAIKKKGYVFLPWAVRARILDALRVVNMVVEVDDADGTVCDALRLVRPKYFANGGDRKDPDSREHAVCKELGIIELFGIGGEKTNSSSKIINDNHAHTLQS